MPRSTLFSSEDGVALLRNSSETGDYIGVQYLANQLLNIVAAVTDLDEIERHHVDICEVPESDIYTKMVVSYLQEIIGGENETGIDRSNANDGCAEYTSPKIDTANELWGQHGKPWV